MDISSTIGQLINDNSTVEESNGDYRNEDGLLVCGVCGEKKERYIDIQYLNISHKRVRCICKCEKERIEKEKIKSDSAALVSKMREASLMDSKFEQAKFENFRQTQENQTIFKKCKKYATEFERMEKNNCGLLMWGNVGTGKSYTAACIANYLLENGITVMMTSFVKLLEICRGDKEESIISQIQNARLVIFDDLGAERSTDYAIEKVYNIIDGRYRAKKPMILTTNLSLDDMLKETDIRYERIYDRIFEVCYPMQFSGTSWRKRRAYSWMKSVGNFLEQED